MTLPSRNMDNAPLSSQTAGSKITKATICLLSIIAAPRPACSIILLVDRDCLWRAQTPQLFRLMPLLRALRLAPPGTVTDEASALERLGWSPSLVSGDERNLKITRPGDLALADALLRERHPGES